MFERFTRPARTAVRRAVTEADARGDRHVGTEHLLIGVLTSDEELGRSLGLSADDARRALGELDVEALAAVGFAGASAPVERPVRPHRRWHPRGHLPFTAGAKGSLTRALEDALDRGDRSIDPAHIAAGILDGPAPDLARRMVARGGVDPDVARRQLRRRRPPGSAD